MSTYYRVRWSAPTVITAYVEVEEESQIKSAYEAEKAAFEILNDEILKRGGPCGATEATDLIILDGVRPKEAKSLQTFPGVHAWLVEN